MIFPLEGGDGLILNTEEGAVLSAEIIAPPPNCAWISNGVSFHFYLNVCSNGRTKDHVERF